MKHFSLLTVLLGTFSTNLLAKSASLFSSPSLFNKKTSLPSSPSSLKQSMKFPVTKMSIYAQYGTYFDYNFRGLYADFANSYITPTPFNVACSTNTSNDYSLFLESLLKNSCNTSLFSSDYCTGCEPKVTSLSGDITVDTPSSNLDNLLNLIKHNLLVYRNQTDNVGEFSLSPISSGTSVVFPNNLTNGATLVYMMEAVGPMAYFPGTSQDTLITQIKTLLTQIKETQIPSFQEGIQPVNARVFVYLLLSKSVQGTVLATKLSEIITAANGGKIVYVSNAAHEDMTTVSDYLISAEINGFTGQARMDLLNHY